MRLRRFALGFLFVVTASLSAQQLSETVTIEVVDVPVFVTRGGTPVIGLTREDFELYVNGKPQPIEYFDVVSTSTAPPGNAVQDLRQRRLTLLLFDLAFSDIIAITRARRAAAQLIVNAPAGDLFAVATYSGRTGVRFATPFTRDRRALARGIASLDATRSRDPLSIVMTPAEREEVHARGSIDTPESSLPEGLVGEAERDMAQTVFQRGPENQVLDLTDLGRRLAALQGQKHVVLLSEGHDGANRPNTIKTPSMTAGFTIYKGGISSAIDGGVVIGRMLQVMMEMGREFQAADVFLHTVDLEGVGTLRGNEALFVLADETGGRFIRNRNDLGVALTDLSSSLRHTYVLGFAPRNARANHNRIEVRVRGSRRGIEVRHREGFSGIAPKRDPEDGLYLADVVMNDVPQTGTAPALSFEGETLRVTLPMKELAAQVSGSDSVELLVYLFAEDGAAVGFHRQRIEVPSGASESKTVELTVPSAHTAKALLRVKDSLGFSRVQR